ncbi:IS701 family transposase [Streptomyces sp. PTD5-9]|uniref:IS701 family transposase n=1 Tax=Streptomyces sp. PTD5-9 TaxID=3120150 RepID=UPI003008E680
MVTSATTRSRTSVPVFADTVFENLPRTDQRRWAHVYLQSLLTTTGKKSVRRLAATASQSPTASQSLHQFINASPWDWAPVREELSRWTARRMTPLAYAIDLAVIRKRGEHSCGVHRRFVPATGRSVTCQVGIGAFLTDQDLAVPVDWRLMLPGAWAKDPDRRRRTRIPDDIGQRPLEQHVLDLVDHLLPVTAPAPVPVLADLSAEPGAGGLVRGLAQRNRDFVVAVPGNLPVVAGRHLRLTPHSAVGDSGLVLTARSLFEIETGGLARIETIAPGPGAPRPTTVLTGFVALPGTAPAPGVLPRRTYRLFALRDQARRPAQLWLTNLTHSRVDSLLEITRLQSRTTETVQRLEEDFGLADFEGRSFPGWHHHMTLVSAAFAYSRLSGSGSGPGGGFGSASEPDAPAPVV